MEFTITSPAVLFPAISLLFLAFTNRFLHLSALVRKLHSDWLMGRDPGVRAQVRNLKIRIDLIRWCQACLPFIGEVQVADNPGRNEPGTGEINYPGVARALKAMGYAGPVGLESFASGSEEAALGAFRQAFTV